MWGPGHSRAVTLWPLGKAQPQHVSPRPGSPNRNCGREGAPGWGQADAPHATPPHGPGSGPGLHPPRRTAGSPAAHPGPGARRSAAPGRRPQFSGTAQERRATVTEPAKPDTARAGPESGPSSRSTCRPKAAVLGGRIQKALLLWLVCLGSPPRQPHPRRSRGRVAPPALGRPSELAMGTPSAKVAVLSESVPTRCQPGLAPSAYRTARWHLADLLRKPGGPRVPLACPWRLGSLGRWEFAQRLAQLLQPDSPRGLGGTRRRPGRLRRWTATSEPREGRGMLGGCSRHQPDPRAPVSRGP